MKKWLLAVLVCTLAVTGCSKYKQVSDLPETDETTETESMSGETTEETLEVQQETEPAEPQKERVRVKGVYISGYMAGSEGFQAILDKIDQTEINAVVIDVKNDDGRITFSMDDAPTVNEIGASERYIRDIGALMADLKARGIYTIARVVAFRDPYLAEKKPEWSLKNADGSLHRDNKGLAWVNPYRQEVWDYLVEVGTQAAKVGFDEIQFDYIRFATDSTMKQVAFDEADTKGRSKTDIITEFITYAYDKLSAEGIFVSADVFGTIIGSKIDADAVGQVYNDMARHLDYICPMIYPSHYGDGNFGIEHPDTQPYDTIYAALMKSKQDLAIVTAAGEGMPSCAHGFRISPLPIYSITSNTAPPRCEPRFRPSMTPDTMNGSFGAHPTNIRGMAFFRRKKPARRIGRLPNRERLCLLKPRQRRRQKQRSRKLRRHRRRRFRRRDSLLKKPRWRRQRRRWMKHPPAKNCRPAKTRKQRPRIGPLPLSRRQRRRERREASPML